jgi:hypothetical protein
MAARPSRTSPSPGDSRAPRISAACSANASASRPPPFTKACTARGRRATSQLDGLLVQALGRGLLPRLSMGTLQLSMRCSSVHFGPSRSLPVSSGRRVCAGVAPRSCRLSSAWAQEANAMTSKAPAIPRGNLMQASSNVWASVATPQLLPPPGTRRRGFDFNS